MYLCIDCGGSYTKVVLKYDEDKYLFSKHTKSFPYLHINKLIAKYSPKVAITGIKSKFVEFSKINADVEELDEIMCVSNIVKYAGYEGGIVCCIGTGTPIIQYKNGECTHLNGTGLGGGTFKGLSKMLLNEDSVKKVYSLARKGDISNINLTMADVSWGDLSFLKKDFTVSNFAKETTSPEDIAIGIHSLVAEPIGCLAAATATIANLDAIIFSGAVSENKIIREILTKTIKIYDKKAIFIDNAVYGTCLGAIKYLEDNN